MPDARVPISVVIPCHNYARFVGEAVASADSQSRRPDEILIVDDGSSDDSWEVISAIAEGRDDVVIDRHDQAWGLVQTFNDLVARSTGEIVIPLSADDRLGPDFLKRMEEDLLARDLDFGYTDFRCFGAEDFFFDAPEMDVDRLARSNFITATAGIRRRVFDEVGGYNLAFDRFGFEDYDYWLRCIEHGMVGAKVHGPYLEWRRHPQGSRNTASRWDRYALRAKLVRHHPRFFLHPRTVRALRYGRSQ